MGQACKTDQDHVPGAAEEAGLVLGLKTKGEKKKSNPPSIVRNVSSFSLAPA